MTTLSIPLAQLQLFLIVVARVAAIIASIPVFGGRNIPVLLKAGLVVGMLVSIFQAATSINEMTLTFIPKMLAVAVALLIFFPWMLQVMIEYTQNLINTLPTVIR